MFGNVHYKDMIKYKSFVMLTFRVALTFWKIISMTFVSQRKCYGGKYFREL